MVNLKGVFNYINGSCWQDTTSHKIVFRQAKMAVKEMLSKKKYSKKKLLYRIAGQSGSGKTTQVLQAVVKAEEMKKNNAVVMAVREFSQFHPHYKELEKNFKKGELREKTNGFALKCLCVALKHVIEKGYMIVLDVTILHPVFEEFIFNQLCKKNYEVQYHVLAVNKKQSNMFIAKRKNDALNVEGGRIVSKASKDYFYSILLIGLKYLSKVDKTNMCVVWTAYDKTPIYFGRLAGATKAIKEGRMVFKAIENSEEELLESKLQWIYCYKFGKTTSE